MRLLAYTDSKTIGGAELALGYLLGALVPEIEVGVLAIDQTVAAAIAGYRPGTLTMTVNAPKGVGDHAALREHMRAVRAFSPDVLHANQAWPWACAYGEIAGLLTPGTGVLAVEHLPVMSKMPRVRRLGRQLLARRLQAHVAVGERAARLVERIVGLPHGSVGSAPNGVPVDLASNRPVERVDTAVVDKTAADEAITARKPGVVIGSLGRLTEQKGYDLLVRALADLPDARLVLVGDGPERGRLEQLASELGVAGSLSITGWVADARARLAGFDLFALPSGWEGMPLGILEAMHAGLPVVATDVGSVSEVVKDGDTGYLLPPGDLDRLRERLAWLLADPKARTDMGRRGQLVALESFTDTAMAARYEAIYDEMIHRRRAFAVRPTRNG